MEVTNYLLGYKKLKIVQNTEMFNFSLDSVLLPNFITISKHATKIMDIGCGNAPIPLILSTKTNAKIIGVEIQKEVSELAKKSVSINNLENQIEIINGDIKNIVENSPVNTFDIITCNPPFFEVNDCSKFNKNDYKTIARHEVTLNIEELLIVAKRLLKNDGVLGIVHRPERLIDVLEVMRKYNIEPKRIRFVYPKKDKEANILLIEGRKNGKKGIKICPPLYSHEENGNYTLEVQKYFE